MSEILSIIDVNNYGIQSMVAGGADLQEKTATPTTSQQVIQADEGYDGLSSVTVNAVTSAIDENIIPTNIRTGKTILGVQGNLEPDKPDQNKTVTPSTVEQVIRADTGYELAQVTVEAVPDETPELNAQDTALSNQETVIGQLSSALDDKIALDLQAATSDANATAGDIAQNKTAYVNGVKLTGTAISGGITITGDGFRGFYNCKCLKEVPKINFENITTDIYGFFGGCTALDYVGNLDLSDISSCGYLFSGCTSLVTAPNIIFKDGTTIEGLFYNCTNLVNVPVYTIINSQPNSMFYNCPNLSNQSLNNIMQMCINSSGVYSPKTLAKVGLSEEQTEVCKTLSNWNALVAAGWSTGYES